MKKTDHELLREFVDSLHPITDEAWRDFVVHWQPLVAKRKSILTAAGETEKYVYFVLQGIQRAYYASDNDKEATVVFTYPYSFSGVADSALTQLPSKFYFETLTASRFLRLPVSKLFELMDQHHCINQLILKTLALTLYGVLNRQAEIQLFSSEEKFKTLLKRSPHLLNLVPHKYIASYLGIDATNFSKLLASVEI
jgi:CRP-like cAMP-binding protein